MGIQYDILFHYFYFKKKGNYLYIYTNIQNSSTLAFLICFYKYKKASTFDAFQIS